MKKNQISSKAPKGDISKTRNIFIPIHKGNHFTCVVVFIEEKGISYYNSLKATNRTRNSCVHKQKKQEKILGVVIPYLQDEFKKNGYNLIDQNNWELETLCEAPNRITPRIVGYWCACIVISSYMTAHLILLRKISGMDSDVKRWGCLFCQSMTMTTTTRTMSLSVLKGLGLRLYLP